MRKIMIIHPGRVGSTVLSNLLGKTQGVFSAGEIYNENVNLFTEKYGKPWWEIYPNYLNFLDFLLQEAADHIKATSMEKPDDTCYIFEYKLHLPGCEDRIDKVLKDMHSFGVDKFIFLHRKNYIRRLVSVLISAQTNVWKIEKGEDFVSPKIHIDVDGVNDYDIGISDLPLLKAIECYNEFVQKIKSEIKKYSILELTYESNIEKNPSDAHRLVCDFLDLQYCSLEPDIVRQNTLPLRYILDNLDEVVECLVGSGYEYYLEN
jgi:hypothetical protein